GGVEGAREDVLEEDGVRNPDGLGEVHRGAQLARAEVLVAGEGDLADLDGGAFLDVEGELDRGRRYGFYLGADDGVLMAVLTEHLLEDDFGVLDLGPVELALDGDADLFLLEAVEHVR